MSKINELIQTLCPDGVEYKKLLDVAESFTGLTYSPHDKVEEGLGTLVLRSSNIQNNKLCFEDNVYVGTENIPERALVKNGDILICVRNGSKALVGKAAKITGIEHRTAFGVFMSILRADKRYLNEDYLFYVWQFAYNELRSRTDDSMVINQITKRDFANIEIPVPPLPVQEEIVRILDEYTDLEAELEAKLSEEIELKQKQYDFYRNELLTFENTVEWNCLDEVCHLVTGATPSKSISKYWDNGTISWMSSGEVNLRIVRDTEKKITQLGYDSASTKIVPVHSVIIALAGQGKTRGKVAINEIELCTNQSLCSMICGESLDYKYLYYYLDSKYEELRAISNGDGNRGGLSLKILAPYKIPVPSLTEQERIVKILDKYDTYTRDMISTLNTELESRKKQYAYYRDRLLTFKRKE